MQTISDNIKRYGFLIGTFLIAVLAFLYNRRGSTIAELHTEAKINVLGQKAADIKEQLSKEGQNAEQAKRSYENLKRIHGDTLARLGIVLSSNEDSDRR